MGTPELCTDTEPKKRGRKRKTARFEDHESAEESVEEFEEEEDSQPPGRVLPPTAPLLAAKGLPPRRDPVFSSSTTSEYTPSPTTTIKREEFDSIPSPSVFLADDSAFHTQFISFEFHPSGFSLPSPQPISFSSDFPMSPGQGPPTPHSDFLRDTLMKNILEHTPLPSPPTTFHSSGAVDVGVQTLEPFSYLRIEDNTAGHSSTSVGVGSTPQTPLLTSGSQPVPLQGPELVAALLRENEELRRQLTLARQEAAECLTAKFNALAYSQTYEQSGVPILYLSVPGHVLGWNKALRDLFLYSESDLGSRVTTWKDMLHPDCHRLLLKSFFASLTKHQRSFKVQSKCVSASGNTFEAKISISIIASEQGKALYTVIHVLDTDKPPTQTT